MKKSITVLLLLGVAASAHAQTTDVTLPPQAPKRVNLSAPRVGMTTMGDGVRRALADRAVNVNSPVSQFGWQFERQFYARSGGVAAVNEWVFLVGGLEQGVVLPSATWLVGLRSAGGLEVGVGPNVTPAGVALAVAAGVTLRSGFLNVPVNVAVVPSRHGTRVSLLTGFNLRGR